MKKLTKAEKAKRLVELTGSERARREFDSSTPVEHRDLHREFEADTHKLSIDLRAKHYSEAQLDAQRGTPKSWAKPGGKNRWRTQHRRIYAQKRQQ